MGEEDMPHGMDTTIYLVQKVTTEKEIPLSKKRRKETESTESEEEVEKIYADSRRLGECSKYFKTCMDERWAQSKRMSSKMEFHLELQADILYYRDCFSRMKPLSFLKPIPSVEYCLELMKVASQIVYQEVVDLGIKRLAAAPLSSAEEEQVRSFCESGYIFLDLEVHGELIARLRLPLNEKERQEEVSNFTHGEVLSHYLDCALEWPMAKSCHVFEEAFRILMFGSNDYAQAECVTLVKTATENLLLSLNDKNGSGFREDVISFCWLYGLLRSVNSAQSIVESVLTEREFVHLMPYRTGLAGEALKKWIMLIHSMLRDVLDGRLFLSTSERYSLFMDWHLMFDTRSQDVFDDYELTELFTTYVMTFPLEVQNSMIRSWETRKVDPKLYGTAEYFIFDTYETWMMRLVKGMASKSGQELPAAEGEISRQGSTGAEKRTIGFYQGV